MIKLSATMTVRMIFEDILQEIPKSNNPLYIMGLNQARAWMLRLSEEQNERILEKVMKKLALYADK